MTLAKAAGCKLPVCNSLRLIPRDLLSAAMTQIMKQQTRKVIEYQNTMKHFQ